MNSEQSNEQSQKFQMFGFANVNIINFQYTAFTPSCREQFS